MNAPLLTVKQVATELGFTPKTIRRRAEELGAVKVFGELRFRPSTIERVKALGSGDMLTQLAPAKPEPVQRESGILKLLFEHNGIEPKRSRK